MFQIEVTSQFKKDLKRIKKRSSHNLDLIQYVVVLLKKEGVQAIPSKMRPHKLTGNFKGTWECHVLPDLLIIWFQFDEEGVIRLVRAGTHSDLFG
jgi:mRNA interferase YafQ